MSIIGNIIVNKHASRLRPGDKAPVFSVNDENGNRVSLGDYQGKKLVLYFYPQDDTPGCTAESCNLRDNYSLFLQKGYEVLGVSADDERSHQKFIKKYRLPFRLLADVEMEVIKAYDVWGTKTLFGKTYDGIIRTTFVIDENGIIEKVITNVDTKEHTTQLI